MARHRYRLNTKKGEKDKRGEGEETGTKRRHRRTQKESESKKMLGKASKQRRTSTSFFSSVSLESRRIESLVTEASHTYCLLNLIALIALLETKQ